MKKACICLLLLALMISVVTILPGCENDKQKAKEIFDESRTYTKQTDAIANELMARQGEIFAATTMVNSVEQFQLSETLSESYGLNFTRDKELAEEQIVIVCKMDGLKDIGDYEKYRELKLEHLDDLVKMSDAGIALFAEYLPSIYEKLDAGEQVDIDSVSRKVEELFENAYTEAEKAIKIREEIEQLIEDKEL